MAKLNSGDIEDFQKKLLFWFSQNKRQFPWRKSKLTRYQIIIAETLLQRTKAETVAKFYPNFIKKYPNWKALAMAETNEIEEFIKPIGLYKQRSLRLKSLAVEMVKRNGRLPNAREDLETIPFFGQYIANSINLLIFKKPSPLLDVNMARVLERHFGNRKMADIRYDPYLQDLAYKYVKHDSSKELNWAILDFAAKICKAYKPVCQECGLRINCAFWKRYNNA